MQVADTVQGRYDYVVVGAGSARRPPTWSAGRWCCCTG
jgi:hypothetical protein